MNDDDYGFQREAHTEDLPYRQDRALHSRSMVTTADRIWRADAAGIYPWVHVAAYEITQLDGIRPNLRDNTGGLGGDEGARLHMQHRMAEIIMRTIREDAKQRKDEIMNDDECAKNAKTQLNQAAKLIGGKPRGLERGAPQIYMKVRRDITVYYSFPDFPTGDADDLLGGAKLCVYIDDCGQAPKWYASQKAIVRRNQYGRSLALSALRAGMKTLALELVHSDCRFTERDADAIAHAIDNDHADEAREIVAGLNEDID